MEKIQRLKILEQVNKGALSLISAIKVLKINYRHGKRLLARYRREGPERLAHKRRGEVVHDAFDPAIRERAIKLHQKHYSKFNDTHYLLFRRQKGIESFKNMINAQTSQLKLFDP